MTHAARSRILAAGVFSLGVFGFSNPQTTSQPIPRPASGDISTAFQRLTAARRRICLNGLWQFQPAARPADTVPRDGWGYSKVPGTWANYPWYGSCFYVYDATMKQVSQWAGADLPKYEHGWYRRLVRLPAEWQGRRIILRFDGIDGTGTVFWNGKRVATLAAFDSPEVEVTTDCRSGGDNELAVLISSAPMQLGPRVGPGLLGDVWLEVRPAEVELRNVQVITAVSGMNLKVRAELANLGKASQRWQVSASVLDGEKVVKEVAGREVEVAAGSVAPVELSAGWPEAELWSPEQPKLYEMRFKCRATGAERAPVADEVALRFGFREFSIRGGDFYLNGKKTHLRFEGGWHDVGASYMVLDETYLRQFFRHLKELNYNGFFPHVWWMKASMRMPAVDVADEMGLLVMLPGPPFDDSNYASILRGGQERETYEARLRARLNQYRNNPSVVMWCLGFMGFDNGYTFPHLIDGLYLPRGEDYQNQLDACRVAERLTRRLDETRPVISGYGNVGAAINSNPYLVFTVPLQEAEDWPSRWSERKRKPLIAREFTATCSLFLVNSDDWERMSAGVIKQPQVERLLLENAARYFGDEAYAMARDSLPEVYTDGDSHYVTRYDATEKDGEVNWHLQSEAFQRLAALYAERQLRAWRAYGTSGLFLFGQADPTCYQNCVLHAGSKLRKGQQDKLETPGAKLDEVWQPLFTRRTLAFDAIRDGFDPLLVYIGGPPGKVTSKEHAYFAGERVVKQMVLANDTTEDVKVQATWRLEDAGGKPVQAGTLSAVVSQGEVATSLMTFPAPPMTERREYTLRLEALAGKEKRKDSFALQVFPRQGLPKGLPRIAVYDETGLTSAMLRDLGVGFDDLTEVVNLSDCSALIVGRESLTRRLERMLAERAFDLAFRDKGLRVAIFEQKEDDLLGSFLEARYKRDVFIKDPSHPVLSGLEPEDFHDWRGASDLTEPYPPQARPGRFIHWGNEGIVSTFVLKKPEVGNCHVLLDCGFDLSQTPLLEVADGRGRALLCQLDVTTRVGHDPVASHLMRNILRWLSQPPAPALTTLVYAGGPRGRQLLERIGVTVRQMDHGTALDGVKVLAVGEGAASGLSKETVSRFLASGGTLVSLPKPAAELKGAPWLPLPAPIEEKQVWRALTPKPLTGLLSGLGNSDFYWKTRHSITVLRPSAGSQVLDPGVACSISLAKGSLVFLQADPEAMQNARAKQKATRILATVLANAGAATIHHVALAAAATDKEVFREDFEGDRPLAERAMLLPQPTTGSATLDNTVAHSGRQSVRVDLRNDDLNYYHCHFPIPVQPSAIYDVSCWIKIEAKPRLDRVALQVDFLDGSGKRTRAEFVPGGWLSGTSDWKEYRGTLTTRPDEVKLVLELRRISAEGPDIVTGSWWTDDIVLRQKFVLPEVSFYPQPTKVSDYDPNRWRQW